MLETDDLHFALCLSYGPFVDANTTLAGGREEPSIGHAQTRDETVLNWVLDDEFFAIIFIEDHLRYANSYVFMFSAANKKSLNLIRLARNGVSNVVIKVKAFVRLDLSMSRQNCIVFAITIQLERLHIEGIVRCLISYIIAFACDMEVEHFALQLGGFDVAKRF